jgi:DNA-binding CsgD family transcriptional regulator
VTASGSGRRVHPGLSNTSDLDEEAVPLASPAVTPASSLIAMLTVRQLETLRWLALGLSQSEAAREMGIGEATVQKHSSIAFAKLSMPEAPVASLIDALRAVGWLVVPEAPEGD